MEKVQGISKKMTLFALTWPIFIETLLRMLMGNVDTFMLSRYSDKAVAGVGVANQIINMVIMLYGIVSTAVIVLVSQYLGAKDKKSAMKVTAVALALSLCFGLMVGLALFLFAPNILKLMNLPNEVMPYSVTFLRTVGGFSFCQAVIASMGAVLRSHGDTKFAMYVAMGMNVLNICGNYLFIFGPFGIPVLGVQGTAMATAFSQFVGLIVMTLVMMKKVGFRLSLKYYLPFPKDILRDMLKVGIPSAGEGLSYSLAQLVNTSIIAMLGAAALSTRMYTMSIMWFIFLSGLAIGQGTQIINGHLIGAGRTEEAYNRCIKSLKIAIAIAFGMAVLMASLGKPLLGIFTSDQSIIAMGSTLLMLTIILEPGRAFNLVVNNSLRAAGDAKFPVLAGAVSMWGVCVGLAYLLGIHFGMGLMGVWIALITDEWLRGIVMLWRWRSRVWVGMSFVRRESLEEPLSEESAVEQCLN